MNALHSVELAPEFAGRVLHDVSMAKHTSWHAGGAADFFFTPRDIMDLASFMRQLPAEVPVMWVGLGSNLLVRDGGIRGAVVSTHGALGALEPGTLGGALAMNAGAWGGETWKHVVEVEVLDRRGVRHTRTPAEYQIGYRQVKGPDNEWFIGARLEFERKPGINTDAIRELLDKRRETQPIGEWSCGSVFTNPPGDHAARLIESAGLKGFRIGDASVSEKHANFIINHGQARSADIEALILHVQKAVKAAHRIELHTEVRIVGEPA